MFVPLVEIHSTLVSDAEVFPILRAKFSAKFTAVIPVYCYCFGMGAISTFNSYVKMRLN